MNTAEQRWAILYHADRVSIEPVENSCRTYECCGDKRCGSTLVEVQADVVAYFQRQADFWRDMTPEAFQEAQGWGEPAENGGSSREAGASAGLRRKKPRGG